MRIGFYRFGLNKPTINAWFGGMYRSFFAALENMGHQTAYIETAMDAGIDILVIPMGGGQDREGVRAMMQFDGPVIMNIGAAAHWFRRDFLTRWQDRILFLYGTDISEYSYKMARSVGLTYHNMPFGSNPEIMRPLDLPKLYDAVFVGNADSGIGRHQYIRPLLKALDGKDVLFLGSGWEAYGYPFQTVAWGKLLNIIYNLSHICLNISNDEQKNAVGAPRMDANNRLFDLGMAGCFQISNAPQLVSHYFDESEVVAIDSPTEWVDAVRHYLDRPAEMEPFRKAAHKRALADHDWKNRARAFVNEIEQQVTRRAETKTGTSSWHRIARLKDAIL